MAFLIGGANTLDDSYSISNSLRFNDSDSQYIYRTPSSETNKQTWTWSAWFKRSDITTAQNLWTAGNDVNNRCHLDINASGTFQVEAKNGGSSVMKCEGGGVLRDPSAWMHLVWRIDTTQGTDSNRMRIYLNGTQFTFSSNSYPSQNTNFEINVNSVTHAIGKRTWADENYFDGYLAEVHFVDGQSYAPTVFGETNDNGVWIPKDCKDDITYGTNGYFLEFKQTGTSANASGIGADTSGNNNHFSLDNFAGKDVVTDTPTNNFMTMNPLYTNSRGAFREGNTQVETNVQGSVPYGQVEFGNFHVNSGKWYFEVRPTTVGSGGSLGLGVNERAYEGTYVNGHNNGGSAGNIRWNHSNGNIVNGSTSTTSGSTYTDDDILGFAMDLDNSKIYCHKNGTYENSGDPAAGSNGITMTSSYSDYWTPWMSKDDTSNNAIVDFNFGNPQFTISSSNSDANGYGNFEYAVPSGFYSLCTKNLATYG